MSAEDLAKWNARYADPDGPSREPSVLLTQRADELPRSGRALDLAGGGGRHSIWLAQHGLDVTLADISPAGLAIAAERAAEAGVSINTLPVDFQTDPFPPGPWNLIISFNFLYRPLLPTIPFVLAPGGLFLMVQPTRTNLQRHHKPPAAFLLEDGELPGLVAGLEIVRYEEGWLAEGRHDACLLARRPAE